MTRKSNIPGCNIDIKNASYKGETHAICSIIYEEYYTSLGYTVNCYISKPNYSKYRTLCKIDWS